MAHKNDYQIQKQLDKPQTWFCKYYPARIRNVGDKEIADRDAEIRCNILDLHIWMFIYIPQCIALKVFCIAGHIRVLLQ